MAEDIKPKSKRGGKREGSGRPPGSPNRATIEQKARIEDLAKSHAPAALKALAAIAKAGESESARVAAANSLLDRAYGRPRQAHEHTGAGGGPIEYRNLGEEEIDARLAALAEKHGSQPLAH